MEGDGNSYLMFRTASPSCRLIPCAEYGPRPRAWPRTRPRTRPRARPRARLGTRPQARPGARLAQPSGMARRRFSAEGILASMESDVACLRWEFSSGWAGLPATSALAFRARWKLPDRWCGHHQGTHAHIAHTVPMPEAGAPSFGSMSLATVCFRVFCTFVTKLRTLCTRQARTCWAPKSKISAALTVWRKRARAEGFLHGNRNITKVGLPHIQSQDAP